MAQFSCWLGTDPTWHASSLHLLDSLIPPRRSYIPYLSTWKLRCGTFMWNQLKLYSHTPHSPLWAACAMVQNISCLDALNRVWVWHTSLFIRGIRRHKCGTPRGKRRVLVWHTSFIIRRIKITRPSNTPFQTFDRLIACIVGTNYLDPSLPIVRLGWAV